MALTHDPGLVAYNNRCMLTHNRHALAWSQWVAIVRHKPSQDRTRPGSAVAIHPRPASMIRIAISLAAYQAIASTMPEDTARPPEPLRVVKTLLVA